MKAKPLPVWDWPAAVLLVAALFSAAVRLDTTNWVPDLGYVESLAVLGTILGLALGLSRFQRGGVFWLASLYSLVIIPMHLSRIITGEQTALGQLASLGGRLAVSINLLFGGKAITDYLFFVTLMAILFWSVGIYSGYQLVRGRGILQVLLPSTLPILVIQYYDGLVVDRIWGLGFYFFLALMLVGRINLLNSRERWEAQHIVSGSEPEFDLNKNIAVAAAFIIMAAWLLPAPTLILPEAASAWQKINQPFESARQRLNDILAAVNSTRINYSANELYGDLMGLGRTAGTGETEFFTVQAPPNDLPRLYWRMRTYDTYEGGSWKMLRSQNSPFTPDTGDITLTGVPPAPEADFTFSWKAGRSAILVTPFQPVWTSRKGSIQSMLDLGGENDPISWNVIPALQTGDQYQVRALLSNPTQRDLRESGTDYPGWVTAHYLQVPGSMAEGYKQLALQLTGSLNNNYDKAEAITKYLRDNITYSETVPNPPLGVEPLNWFLFDLKSGFCDYYASAEVMLLRSLDIPARMAVGFAQGKISRDMTYTVRGQDAHAWPEVYFPGIGWVQFEPTGNQAVLLRPTGESLPPSEHPRNGLSGGSGENPRDHQTDGNDANNASSKITFLGLSPDRWLWIIIYTIIIALVSVLGWRIERQQSFALRIPRALLTIYRFYNMKSPSWVDRWVRWSEVSAVERAFHSVNQALQWLQSPQPDHATPAERSLTLKALLPEAADEIDILNAALEKTLFTPYPADPASAARAGWRLRIIAIRKIVRRWLHGAK